MTKHIGRGIKKSDYLLLRYSGEVWMYAHKYTHSYIM